MKYFTLIIFVLFFQGFSYAQFELKERSLRVKIEENDTMRVDVKFNKAKQMKYLYQAHYEYDDTSSFVIAEEYKKGKYWTLWRFKEVVTKRRKNKTFVKEIVEGKQYQYNERGQPIIIEEYSNGIPNKISYNIEYYDNGNIKFIVEVKDGDFWDFIEYLYPNGKKYDFGDYKNGQGKVTHLNDDGTPCLECITIRKKTKGKLLCD